MKLGYSFDYLEKLLKCKSFANFNAQAVIDQVANDSRKLILPDNTLFVAFKTKRNDGHKFVRDLYDKGVRNFMVSQEIDQDIIENSNVLLVENTVKALQIIGENHRKKFNIPVIGITGSNGKTIVKEWLFQVLSEKFNIVRSPKSYNSQIGVPLSVLYMTSEHDLAIFEAGISEPDEMDRLQKIINPTIGLITNIGHAHSENFINIKQKVNEKIQLFKKANSIVFCRDYGEINQRLMSVDSFKEKSFFTWSLKSKDEDLYVKGTAQTGNKTVVTYIYKGTEKQVIIPFTDKASIENATHVLAISLKLGCDFDYIAEKISRLISLEMRLEMKEGINNCSIINDIYNSDLNSISIAVDFLVQQQQHETRTIILSDILQSGMEDMNLYSKVAAMINNVGINRMIGIGKAIKRQAQLFKVEKHFYDTTSEFLAALPSLNFHNESILLKGARSFEFEKISKKLQQKTHQTVLEINLTALIDNLNFFRSKLKPGVKTIAMVKAFSYGSGSFEIANALQYHNVDVLAVAYADEGIELRKAGIKLPIIVMNPNADSFDMMIYNKLEPEIYNFEILNDYISAVNQLELIPESLKIHLKIDTGMHRLGFVPEDMDSVVSILKANPNIEVATVFSHLVGSDDPRLDYFSNQQIKILKDVRTKLENEAGIKSMMHILNSAGICRFPDAQFDFVRLGIGLYGISSCNEEKVELRNVSSLKTIISQVKKVKKGESVGYNRAYIAEYDMTTATIPIGYADGLSRRLGNERSYVVVNGKEAKIIGNICMDMTMIDVSHIDVNINDQVEIFGNQKPIGKVAQEMGTIAYEVLTMVSRRVKRVYYQE